MMKELDRIIKVRKAAAAAEDVARERDAALARVAELDGETFASLREMATLEDYYEPDYVSFAQPVKMEMAQ